MAAFSATSGWEDVTPVPQDDGDNPVVSISYAAACMMMSYTIIFALITFIPLVRELMDLFRAVLVSGEKSERVLKLTQEILDINAANYTVWYTQIYIRNN
jgi:protein farnesyltransferase/geranylgeranyltransferase type-1 subunit alpha